MMNNTTLHLDDDIIYLYRKKDEQKKCREMILGQKITLDLTIEC